MQKGLFDQSEESQKQVWTLDKLKKRMGVETFSQQESLQNISKIFVGGLHEDEAKVIQRYCKKLQSMTGVRFYEQKILGVVTDIKSLQTFHFAINYQLIQRSFNSALKLTNLKDLQLSVSLINNSSKNTLSLLNISEIKALPLLQKLNLNIIVNVRLINKVILQSFYQLHKLKHLKSLTLKNLVINEQYKENQNIDWGFQSLQELVIDQCAISATFPILLKHIKNLYKFSYNLSYLTDKQFQTNTVQKTLKQLGDLQLTDYDYLNWQQNFQNVVNKVCTEYYQQNNIVKVENNWQFYQLEQFKHWFLIFIQQLKQWDQKKIIQTFPTKEQYWIQLYRKQTPSQFVIQRLLQSPIQLLFINFNQSRLSNKCIMQLIKKFPNVIQLCLNYNYIGNNQCAYLSKLKQLKVLQIKSKFINEQSIMKLIYNIRNLKQIEYCVREYIFKVTAFRSLNLQKYKDLKNGQMTFLYPEVYKTEKQAIYSRPRRRMN